MREEGSAAPSHQWKSQRRDQTQLLLLCRASGPGWSWHPCFVLPHYYLIPLLHLGIARPEPTLFPKGLYLNRGLMLSGKQKEHQRCFLCLVLEGSEMEPLQALGTRPGHSPGQALGQEIRTLNKLHISPRDTADSPHLPSASISPWGPSAKTRSLRSPGMRLVDNLDAMNNTYQPLTW